MKKTPFARAESSEASPAPAVHSAQIRRELTELIEHMEADVGRVDDPRFQMLLATSASVLRGVSTAFADYDEQRAGRLRLQE